MYATLSFLNNNASDRLNEVNHWSVQSLQAKKRDVEQWKTPGVSDQNLNENFIITIYNRDNMC